MKKILFILILITLKSSLFCQILQLKCKVYSLTTKKIIPYATVQISSTKIIDADENGYFEIGAKNTDTVILSSIGFEKLVLPLNTINNLDSLFLKEHFTEMKTVILTKPIQHTIGISNEKQNRSQIGNSAINRAELATLIEVPKDIKSYRIKKVMIKGKDFNAENPIRIHLYTVNEKGEPGEELLTKEIVIINSNDNNKLEVDVKDQDIILIGQTQIVWKFLIS